MSEIILKTKNLTKCYGDKKVLDDINITVQKGRIYGLIGQNGAGKTTLMQTITGLIRPSMGTIELFGRKDEKELLSVRKRIGSMIESPAYYPYMSARENMEAVRISQGIPDKKTIDLVLHKVKLEETGKKKVKDFSLGMKQKLAIAMTLLNQPDFLMLDEPTNGLDPISIVEIRSMLQNLVKNKMTTILISSHILEQLYHLATDYIVIHEGKIIEEITKETLDERCKKHISIYVDLPEYAATVIEGKLKTNHYRIMPDHSINLYDYLEDMESVISTFVKNGVSIRQITIKGDDLENYFVHIIGGKEN